MMRLTLMYVGRTSSKSLQEFIGEFEKRISRFAQLDVIAVDRVKSKSMAISEVMKKEGEALMKKIQTKDLVILLDENGTTFDSLGFATKLSEWSSLTRGRLCFVIGGAHGHGQQVRERANHSFSLSQLTFNHELALAVFIEQLYRGLTIRVGHPYHNQ